MRKRIRLLAVSLACTVLLPASQAGAGQNAPAAPSPSLLAIGGDVRTPLSIAHADLKTMPRTRVEVNGDDGRRVTYEGVLVGELLRRAGAPLGSDLRANALATYVMASATDGYQVVFSLAELDPAMTNSQIIVADTVDGKPLFGYQGPVRIVVPLDARPARSIRMLERIDVVRLKK